MSTSGTGMRPAAPDHSDKRSTKCDASSSRVLSVISAAARSVGTPAESLLSVAPDTVVSCAIGGFLRVSPLCPSIKSTSQSSPTRALRMLPCGGRRYQHLHEGQTFLGIRATCQIGTDC